MISTIRKVLDVTYVSCAGRLDFQVDFIREKTTENSDRFARISVRRRQESSSIFFFC